MEGWACKTGSGLRWQAERGTSKMSPVTRPGGTTTGTKLPSCSTIILWPASMPGATVTSMMLPPLAWEADGAVATASTHPGPIEFAAAALATAPFADASGAASADPCGR